MRNRSALTSLFRRSLRDWLLLGLALGPLACATGAFADFQGSTHMTPFDEDTIGYNKAKADDSITRLEKLIKSGETALKYGTTHGYLESVLRELGIESSSQVLVFSKTSFQRERISPKTPRALYFNDDVYVGYIPAHQ
jgi:hypothetical protein